MKFPMTIDELGLLSAQMGGFEDHSVHYDGEALVVEDETLHAEIEGFLTDPNWQSTAGLAKKKAAKSQAVNAKRDAIIAGGYQHNFGGGAGIRTLDQRTEADAINWLGLKSIADHVIAAGQGSAPIAIRDAGDETFQASASVISGAMVAMGQWRGAVMGYAWALKDVIAAAADAAAVDAIDIDAGWPGA